VNLKANRQGRREWLSRVMRGVFFGALAGLAGPLAVRSWRRGCIAAAQRCGECALLAQCRLPRAVQTKDRPNGAARIRFKTD
jgi:hypothetical protein